MDTKTVYRVHKWLAVVAAVVTLGWFVSGALMVAPRAMAHALARGHDQ